MNCPSVQATPYLDSVIDELSDELHDQGHGPANLAQARNLLRRSGLDEADFVQRLYRAKALTKERLGMREFRLKRPAAYFFVVLRDLLALPVASHSAQGTRRKVTTQGIQGPKDAVSGTPRPSIGTDANRQRGRVFSGHF